MLQHTFIWIIHLNLSSLKQIGMFWPCFVIHYVELSGLQLSKFHCFKDMSVFTTYHISLARSDPFHFNLKLRAEFIVVLIRIVRHNLFHHNLIDWLMEFSLRCDKSIFIRHHNWLCFYSILWFMIAVLLPLLFTLPILKRNKTVSGHFWYLLVFKQNCE